MKKTMNILFAALFCGFALTGCDMLPTEDKVITLSAIPGVVAPVSGEKPVMTGIDTEQYTGTIQWAPPCDAFEPLTEYTAKITLSAKAGWTLTGVAANFFTVAGAKATNDAGSGMVSAVFPVTGKVPGSTDDPTFLAADYVNFEPGFGIRYHVTDTYGSHDTDIYAWVVSQNFETNKPHELDFMATLNVENGDNLENSLGGMLKRMVDGKPYLMFYSGCPVGNQGNFYRNLMLPVEFDVGSSWECRSDGGTKTYTVAPCETVTINGSTFNNCVRMEISASSSTSPYICGKGYFLLVKDIGIVKLEFTRSDGSLVTFAYDTSKQLELHTIAGTVYSTGTTPAVGTNVQISNGDWGIRSVTGDDGKFSLRAYGPDIKLRIGDDTNGNDVLDSAESNSSAVRKELWVNDIAGDRTDLVIDLSTL